MQPIPHTIIWRHKRENLKKCSLRGLEQRTDFQFITFPDPLPELKNYVVLSLDGAPLSKEDAECGLLLLDATWRYAMKMAPQLQANLIQRSIPASYRTAYPRRQQDCSDPDRGLASIEALYIAYHLLGRPTDGLLDNYYWKEHFLEKNF